MQKVSDAQKLEAIIRQLGVAELKMKGSGQIGLSVSLLFGASTSRVLSSWYWHPVWLEFEGQDFKQMWTTCDRGDWLLWFCTHMIDQPGWPTHQQVVLAACQCARIALRHVNSREKRPLEAILTAEAWAHGEATFEEVQRAGHAADCVYRQGDVVFLAAQAAYSAAQVVYAWEDGACFRRAQAASGAATHAASAASWALMMAQHHTGDFTPAASAAQDYIRKAVLRQCADIVRRSLKVPDLLTVDFATPQRPTKKPTTVPTENEHLGLEGYTVYGETEQLQREIDRLKGVVSALDDPEKLFIFGQMSYEGDGVEQSYVEAANWYRIAAEKGHAASQHNLAIMYENGEGFDRNIAEAAKWYQKAAAQGHAGSQNNLGSLYEIGEGVPQNTMAALTLYRQAANGGDANAVSNLSRLKAKVNNESV
jgi:TPR repeat protein